MGREYILLFFFAAIYALPTAKVKPEVNVTEAEMTSTIRQILTVLGYPQTDIEKALEIVPIYYAQKKTDHQRDGRQVLQGAVNKATTVTASKPTHPTTKKPTTPTMKTMKPTYPSSLNSILHELDIFWKGG